MHKPNALSRRPTFSFESHTHLRRDPILEKVLIAAGRAAPNLSRSAEPLVPQDFRQRYAFVPASSSNPIVISSCSPGYSGRSRQTKSLLPSSPVLGNANLASTMRIQWMPDRVRDSNTSVLFSAKFMQEPCAKSLKKPTSCTTLFCLIICNRTELTSQRL